MGSDERPGLTPAESAVYAMIALGLTRKEIACRLEISAQTVKAHTRHIMRKLGVTNRVHVALTFHGIKCDVPEA